MNVYNFRDYMLKIHLRKCKQIGSSYYYTTDIQSGTEQYIDVLVPRLTASYVHPDTLAG